MFKWRILIPLFFASSANGTNFLIGEGGILIPFFEIVAFI